MVSEQQKDHPNKAEAEEVEVDVVALRVHVRMFSVVCRTDFVMFQKLWDLQIVKEVMILPMKIEMDASLLKLKE